MLIAKKSRLRILMWHFNNKSHDDYCLDHGLSGSFSKEMHAVRKLSVWYKIPIWFQSNVCPNTLFQKYKLNQLTTGIHSCIDHVLRKYIYREFLKDATTETSHGKVNSYFFQSLSWLYQLAYFVKCKRTLLKLNFYQPYPSSWREWILSLLVNFLHKTWN